MPFCGFQHLEAFFHKNTLRTREGSAVCVPNWAIPENIQPPPPPMDDTELGTKKFQDFQERQLQLLQDSKA